MIKIALRAIVCNLLTKGSSRRQQFYQAITALGHYSSHLSCGRGWPLDSEEEQPCWRDVAIGIGIKEKYSHRLIKEIEAIGNAEPSLVPLRRLANGRWIVKPDWWRYAGEVSRIPISRTELLNCLPREDSPWKLEAHFDGRSASAEATQQRDSSPERQQSLLLARHELQDSSGPSSPMGLSLDQVETQTPPALNEDSQPASKRAHWQG